MADTRKARQKKILSDPTAMFDHLCPDAPDPQASELRALSMQYKNLGEQYKDARNQAKILSRQIGEAKRIGSPVDGLKASMQEQGTQLTGIADQLAETKNRILGFFEPDNEGVPPKETPDEKPADRIYTTAPVNVDDISISLLDDEMPMFQNSRQPQFTIVPSGRNCFRRPTVMNASIFWPGTMMDASLASCHWFA
jgi:hypothetical protein